MTFLNKCRKIYGHHHRACRKTRIKGSLTVRDLLPGQPAHVAGFSPHLSSERRALLCAYGLVPGYPIRIVQQSPVSVILVEHAEIALEQELADDIFVSEDS